MSVMRKRVLLVDDDVDLLRLLAMRMDSAGYESQTAESGMAALSKVATFRPQVVVSDLRMNGMDGMALFEALRENHPSLPLIIMTAHGTIGDAVDATQRGVFGFITKPIDKEELIQKVEEAIRIGMSNLDVEIDEVWREKIVTQSPLMEALLSQAKRVARNPASVLISGESGTGKGLLAKAIHEASDRKEGPFVAVYCSAIPEDLFEEELFGHKQGALAGEDQACAGLFHAAQGGTLFFDEVADMPKGVQVRLLRVLQSLNRGLLGCATDRPMDVRVISASHTDLEDVLREGRFREDLYYRLNVVTFHIPPLSKRPEDIPLLAHYFLRVLSEEYGDKVRGFSPEAMDCLVCADWPGNVRQLRNVTEQCVALCNTPLIPVTLVQRALRDEPSEFMSLHDARGKFEREYLTRLLLMTGGSVSQAAKMAKRNRTEFYRLLGRYGIKPEDFKGGL